MIISRRFKRRSTYIRTVITSIINNISDSSGGGNMLEIIAVTGIIKQLFVLSKTDMGGCSCLL